METQLNEQIAAQASRQGQELTIKEDDYGQLVFDIPDHDRYDPSVPLTINKSNNFIRAMHKTTTLLSEVALLLALHKVRKRDKKQYEGTKLAKAYEAIREKCKTDFSEGLVAVFSNSEIKDFMNLKSSRFYSEIKDLMDSDGPREFVHDWAILYEDKHGRKFQTDLVTATAYDPGTGKTMVKFNQELEQDIIDLQKNGNYTMLSVESLRAVSKDNAAWNLYQLLKSELQLLEARNRKKGLPDRVEYVTDFGLAELKFLLRLNRVDLESKDKSHRACYQYIKEHNYEEAEMVLPQEDKMYQDWRNLRKRVLTRTCMLINGWDGDAIHNKEDMDKYEDMCRSNHPTEIHYRCVPLNTGGSKKVTGIRFYMRWDPDHKYSNEFIDPDESFEEVVKTIVETDTPFVEEGEELNPDNIQITVAEPGQFSRHEMEVVSEISDIIDEPLKVSDLRSIAKAAGYDIEKIKNIYRKLKEADSDITAEIMIKAVTDGYSDASPRGFDREFYRENFPGFSTDELKCMYEESRKHIAMSCTKSKDLWICDYISFYLKKIDSTSKDTKTTVYKRLMDSLRKDYDHQADVLNNKETAYDRMKKSQAGKSRFDYEQRTYTDEEYKDLEAKKLGIKP